MIFLAAVEILFLPQLFSKKNLIGIIGEIFL